MSGKRKRRKAEADAPRPQRKLQLSEAVLADLDWWAENDPRVNARALRIIDQTMTDPFKGLGKPEPLKHEYQGLWSRRLTRADRLIYSVSDDRVHFLSARFHYPRR